MKWEKLCTGTTIMLKLLKLAPFSCVHIIFDQTVWGSCALPTIRIVANYWTYHIGNALFSVIFYFLRITGRTLHLSSRPNAACNKDSLDDAAMIYFFQKSPNFGYRRHSRLSGGHQHSRPTSAALDFEKKCSENSRISSINIIRKLASDLDMAARWLRHAIRQFSVTDLEYDRK